MRVITALPLFIPIDLPEQLLKVLDEPINLGLLLLTGRQPMWEVVAQHHAYAQAEYEATEEHLAIHTLSSHRMPAEAVVTRARPHDLGRMTRPAYRTCCLTRCGRAHRARSSCPSTTSYGFASAWVIRRHRRGARQADGGRQRLPTSMRCRTAPAVTREFVVPVDAEMRGLERGKHL